MKKKKTCSGITGACLCQDLLIKAVVTESELFSKKSSICH